MTNVSSRWRLAAAASPLALMMAASPAFAEDAAAQATITGAASAATATQAATPADQAAANPRDTKADSSQIVVTGFRAALRSATNTKKRQDQVVEAVNAEDIGKLPDNSIAESIARLPGLAAQRSAGRATIISIRGFGPDFSVTTLNGREQTTTNDSRAVEFDQFPSEVISQVVIYKTPAANLTSQGLVGTIDLRTTRPLDAGKRVIAIGARGTYVDQKLQPNSNDTGYRVYGTYVDQFGHDTFGVALTASYTDEPYQTRDWNAWGYDHYDPNTLLMTGVKTWVESSDLKRLGLNGTAQARLSDNLTMTWDGFYSNFKEKVDQRGFEFPDFPAWGFSTFTNPTTANGFVTGGTFAGVYANVENYAADRNANLYSVGWNTAYDGHNGWRGFVDLSWSRTDRTDDKLETTLGSGYHQSGPSDTIGFNWTPHGPEFNVGLDYSDPTLLYLTDLHGWGGSVDQAGYDKLRKDRDDLKQVHLEIERDLGSFLQSVKVGVNYTDRKKDLSVLERYLIPAGGATQVAIPANLIMDPVNLDRGIGPILSFDPRQLVGAGILQYFTNSDTIMRGQNAAYIVNEKLLTPYIMGVIGTHLGASDLTGNVGVQAVHTDQSSTGTAFPAGVPTQTTAGTKYWELLPSLNLSLRMPSDFIIRFAASKQHMRPRLPDLNATLTYGWDPTHQEISGGGPNGAPAGNPYLKPYSATGVDLNFEKYFGSNGYIALQTFYKHMDRYIAQGIIPFNFAGFPLPGNVPPGASTMGVLSTQANTHGGHIYGAELAGTLPFDLFSPALSGFGLTGGLGYTKSKVKDFNGDPTEIPGYSKWVGNLTAFYEAHGFNVRGSMRYRSKYIGDFVLYSGGLDRQLVLPETVFDAQVGYDFPATSTFSGLSLYLQGQNLTDERSATVDPRIPNQGYMKYQTYGRRFVAGFTYKFGAASPPPPPPPAPPPPPPPAPATQTCPDGSVIGAAATCPLPPPPPPPAPAQRGERG